MYVGRIDIKAGFSIKNLLFTIFFGLVWIITKYINGLLKNTFNYSIKESFFHKNCVIFTKQKMLIFNILWDPKDELCG